MSGRSNSGSGRGSSGRSSAGRSRGGRGNGGRGSSTTRTSSDNTKKSSSVKREMGPPNGHNKPRSKVDRKAGRRAKQLEAMEKKAKEEDSYFRQCQKEARSKRQKHNNNAKTQDELFSKQGSQGINFSKYDDITVQVKYPDNASMAKVPPMKGFDELALTPQLKKNVALMNYTHPTPIQRNALPLAMAGEDLMCCAQTGSGKTCAFLLPIIAALATCSPMDTANDDNGRLDPAKPRCVVLAPTRELALQIELEAQKLTHRIPSVRPVCVYGGAGARSQLRELAFSCTCPALVVVATPGRLTDFVDRSIVSLSYTEYLVLDEADRMLDMGFEPQIRKLVQKSGMTPKSKRQTMLFSATFPPEIQKLAGEFLRDYVWIAVGRVGSTTDSITQKIVKATPDKRRKLQLVVEALESGPDGRTLIFVQKKRTATWLKKQLNKGGPDDGKPSERFTPIAATDIHGDRSQSQREAALESFRSGTCRVLVATDVAARGLDISGVEHVINMDLPTAREEFDTHVHRIGRTGRAGHVGLATSLFVPGHDPKVANGKIAGLLVAQLKESGQEVPGWLEAEVAGGGGGGVTPAKRKQQFGGSDVRRGNGGKRQEQSRSNGGRNSNGGSRGRNSSGGRGRGRL